MFNRFEIIGGVVSIFFMGLAIYLVQVETTFKSIGENTQAAQVTEAADGISIVSEGTNSTQARAQAYLDAADNKGNINRMVLDDIKVGTGEPVKEGDTVAVHYVGTLQNGEEFDNSKKRGTPFEFTVGEGMVIEGWEEGLVGMQAGGQRVLVVPPDKAYGEQGIGPIPGGATLVFAIELLEIK